MERHVYHTPSLYYTKKRPERKGMTYGNDKKGYRSFELGYFKEKTRKSQLLKCLKKSCQLY